MPEWPPRAAKRLNPVYDNVWEWVASISQQSPVQPISNMGQGFIEFNPPEFLIQAHVRALNDLELNQYGPTLGSTRFKRAIASVFSSIYRRPIITETEIALCTGATEGILSTLMAFVEPGDEVIVLEPAFSLYFYLIEFVGGVVRSVKLKPEGGHSKVKSANDWKLEMRDLEDAISPCTKMLILNTPHNPLGKVFAEEELRSIGIICVRHNVIILSDEVYERTYYTPSFPRIATINEEIGRHVLSLSSIGKSFNATGWRVGYLIGSDRLIQPVQWAHVLQCYVTPGPAQGAAADALLEAEKNGFWQRNKELIGSRVDDFCHFLDELNLPYFRPLGAYFILVNINSVRVPEDLSIPENVMRKPPDFRVCWFLMHKLGVSSIPGSAFYKDERDIAETNYLRFTVCKTTEELEVAKNRLRGLKEYIC